MVEVVGKSESRPTVAKDIGRHGLFVLSPEPPPERHVVRLVIHTRDGPVPATAWVSRRVLAPAPVEERGAGLEFFSLSRAAKDRWDAYFRSLDHAQAQPGTTTTTEAAAFLVRLTTREKLTDFAEGCVREGRAFLVTPVLKPPGARVSLHVVHPVSDEEFVIWGRITRVQPGRPKGIEIAFTDAAKAQVAAFHAFIKSGVSPTVEPPASLLPASVTSVDVDFDVEVDEDALLESEIFLWEDVSQVGLIDLDIDDEVRESFDDKTFEMQISVRDGDPVVGNEREDRSEYSAFPLPPTTASDCLQSPTSASDPFQSPTSASDPFQSPTTASDPFQSPTTASDPFQSPTTSSDPLQSPTSAEELLAKLDAGLNFHVVCQACALDARITVGRAHGLIGLIADLHPLFCATCRTIHTAPRPNADQARKERILELSGGEKNIGALTVPLALVLDVAALFAPSRCPTCRGPMTSTLGTRALEREAPSIPVGEELVIPDACPACHEGNLSVHGDSSEDLESANGEGG